MGKEKVKERGGGYKIKGKDKYLLKSLNQERRMGKKA